MKISTIRTLAILSIGSVAAVAAQETPTPTPAMTPYSSPCSTVSVEGDAIFCIEGPVCSGSGAIPTAINCPQVGEIATSACWDYFPSYSDGHGCVAPVYAECKPLPSGAWGCAWRMEESGSGSGMGDNDAGSSSTSGSGSGSSNPTITIPDGMNSTEAQDPEDIQLPTTILPASTKRAED